MTKIFFALSILVVFVMNAGFYGYPAKTNEYIQHYLAKVSEFNESQGELLRSIQKSDLDDQSEIKKVREQIHLSRLKLKDIDFWLRYLEPIAYKKINGPLPVEWETEVFEKFENPYKRDGAGLTLAELYLDEKIIVKDTLIALIESSKTATQVFLADSITQNLTSHHSFFLANRLFLLNLAAIYTTGFECPDTSKIIPELISVMEGVKSIYEAYNHSFPSKALSNEYLALFDKTLSFSKNQSVSHSEFNHFEFIQKYVNPLFSLNQEMVRRFKVKSVSYNDYSLNNESNSIFDKTLFQGQNPKGVYYSIKDEETLNQIKETGKLLFYDPILSANFKRSCASCHKPEQYFTDTVEATPLHFDQKQSLQRNTPTLINVVYNHLINVDGKHFTLQNQVKDVISNQAEMAGQEDGLLEKVMSCDEYKKAFKEYSKLTPYSKTISIDHVVSAITLYISGFSRFYSPFDNAMNQSTVLDKEVIKGFNLFMGKAECGTCHFVPQFNGVKPPYTNSEFEVLGVPQDRDFKSLSPDKGRYSIHSAQETMNAFRTGTIRNAIFTKPYMHNGIFKTLQEVMDFYNEGGGGGRLLTVDNQTLSADSLQLSDNEVKAVVDFIGSLSEKIEFPKAPEKLPVSSIKTLNSRKVGGEY